MTAAAAAMAGLTRCVRPPGPCRPSKLRLLVLAERWPGLSLSGFMARHMLHPACRHSAPASLEDPVQPLGLGLVPDRLAAGHDRAPARRGPSCGRGRPARPPCRSSIRPLVHEPMKTTSTGISLIGVPGIESHVVEGPPGVVG